MDPAYEKLKSYRERKDLAIKPAMMPNLRETFLALDGKMRPLKIRYYQVQGILHLVKMNRFLLGDDTGLGKTLMAIASLCVKWRSNPNQKVVILSPKSAIGQWASEFEKFTHGVQTFQALGGPKKRQETYKEFLRATGPCVLILNYERARIDFRTMQRWKNYYLICDEATKFKNPKAHIYQVVRHMSRQASACWCLTATLIKNNLLEGYAIIECMLPGTFGVVAQFMKHYCRTRKQSRGKGKGYTRVITGYYKRHIEAFKVRIDPVFLSRAKYQVAKELPVLTTRRVIVGMNPQQKMKYEQALSGMIHVDKDRFDEEGKKVEFIETDKLTALMRCQQIVDHPDLVDCEGGSDKMDNLLDLLENDFEGDKVIVFTKFSQMVDLLMPVLKKKGYNPVRITGKENDKQRKEAMAKFQDKDSDVKVICITVAASDAINLQMAKCLVFYDLPWSAGDYLQTLGRMIRIGSLYDRVYAVHLLGESTIDLYVERVLNDKMDLIEQVIGKRIKGEKEETTFVKQEDDISNIYNMMIEETVRKAS